MSAIVVAGDVLLDRDVVGAASRLCPDAPAPVVEEPETRSRPGGAGLAAAVLAAGGHAVRLVTALGDDGAGAELADLLARSGVEVLDLGRAGRTPEKVRVRAGRQSLARLDYGVEPGPPLEAPSGPRAERWLAGAEGILVSDYGQGVASSAPLRDRLSRAARAAPLVWDPHPRGAAPVAGTRVATPNDGEARIATGDHREGIAGARARGERLVRLWRTSAVSITLGPRGALMTTGSGSPLVAPATPAPDGVDACGAGDSFAGAMAAALAAGAVPSEALWAAVSAASDFVAAGGAASLDPGASPGGDGDDDPAVRRASAETLARRVRRRGGTVVATGGCFDLLHAGHIACLEAARRLGDCLVVCVNSDRSVARLKGPGRPVVPEEDRVATLLGLACVDAVTVFDEDTPARPLRELRPHVFAKGGDYAAGELPEEGIVREWSGEVVLLPYLGGRSSTALIERVRSGAGRRAS